MNYEDFKKAWIQALRESALPLIGIDPVRETLELRSMHRTCTSYVEPFGGQDTDPFHVSANLEYRWGALQTARTATTEEDLLTELLGREGGQRVQTERPWLRVDVKLQASLPYGKAIPMPSSSAWAKWAREAIGRLQGIEPVVPADTSRQGRDGRLEILAWQGEPEARVLCGPRGDLKLDALKLSSWQAIELPRHWDDPDRPPDEPPDEQLSAMFTRVKSALRAWMEVMDHLRPQRR